MGTSQRQIEAGCVEAQTEVTDAALGAYGRLLATFGERLRTHPTRDGGLICEDRKIYTRPAMWRIAPNGVVLPDNRYSFTLRAFTPAALPQGV